MDKLAQKMEDMDVDDFIVDSTDDELESENEVHSSESSSESESDSESDVSESEKPVYDDSSDVNDEDWEHHLKELDEQGSSDSDSDSDMVGGGRKRRKDKAIREIRKYQQEMPYAVKNLIPKAAFRRLVKEVSYDFRKDLRFTKNALDAIQEATESYLVEMFKDVQSQGIHAKRKTIVPKDVQLTRYLQGERI